MTTEQQKDPAIEQYLTEIVSAVMSASEWNDADDWLKHHNEPDVIKWVGSLLQGMADEYYEKGYREARK